MGSLGSASIELTLERSQFDKDIKSLSSQKLDPIGVKLEIDTKDFDKQIKGLAGFIEPLLIPLGLDTKGIARQLKELKLDCIPVNICPDFERLERKLKDFDGEIYVKVKFDEGQVQSAVAQINTEIKAGIETTVKIEQSGSSSGATGADVGDAVSKSMASAFERQMAGKRQDEATNNFVDFTLSPIKAFTSSLNSIATGALENIGKGLTSSLSKSLSESLNKEIGGALSSAGGKTGGLLGQLGKTLGVDGTQGKSSQKSFGQLETELKPVAKDIQAITQALQKAGLDIGGFGGQINKATGAAVALASAFAKLEGAVSSTKPSLPQKSNTSTQGFLSGDTTALTPLQARGQVEGTRKQLEARLGQLKQLPKTDETRTKIAELVRDISNIEKAIAVDGSNSSIPESVRRSLGQLKSSRSALSKLKTEAARLSLNTKNSASDRETKSPPPPPPWEIKKAPPARPSEIGLSKFGTSGSKVNSRQEESLPKFTQLQDEARAGAANFNRIFKEVAKLSGLDPATVKGVRPKMAAGALPEGVAGQYNPGSNTVNVSGGLRSRLAQGLLTTADLDTLIHEIRHALQLDFGKVRVTGLATGKQTSNLKMREQKGAAKLTSEIEASVEEFGKAYKQQYGKEAPQKLIATIRKLETDAYLFAGQAAEQIAKNLGKVLKINPGSAPRIKDRSNPIPPPPREVMRPNAAPEGVVGTQDYWEQQFRRLEARFYRSGMMKNVAPKERRSLTSEATGFLFSGAAMAAPGATFMALLAPLAPAIAPLAVTFGLLNNVLQPLIGTIVEALRKLEPAQRRLEYVGGSKEGGIRETNFALGVSDELKTPALASLEGYSKLAAAAKGTSLEGGKTRDLFVGISTAAKAMQLSQEDLNLVMLGFTQIISKGKLSAEEVRQQIAERLPGAFNIFAKSLGLSVTEFNQLLESGSLLSEDVIPKLAKGLQQEFGQAAKESSGSFLSSLTRIDNAFFKLQKGLADVFGPVLTTFANGFAQLVELAAKYIKPLIQIFNVAMIGIAAQFFVGLTTIMNGSGITTKLTAFLIPAFARVFTTLTPFAVGMVADFLDDVFGAKSSVMDNMMKGVYNAVLSIVLVVDGAIKKFKELLNISDSVSLKAKSQKAGVEGGNKIVDTLAPAALGALSGATLGLKGGVIGAAAGGIFGLVGGMDLLRKVIPSTVIEFASLTLMLIQVATLAKMALFPVLANLANSFKALSLAFLENVNSGGVFKSSLSTLTAGLASSQLVMAGATAAVLLFFAKADFSDEMGSKFDKLGSRMSEALYKIRDAAADASKSLDKLPLKTPDFKSKGFDLTLGFGGENGFRTDDVIKANRGEQSNPFIRALTFSPILSAANAVGFKPSTLGEKQFDDTLLKIAEQSQITGKSIDNSGLLDGTFSQTKAGQSFESIKSVDSQIKSLQQQRLGIVSQVGATKDPNSIKEVQGVDKQIKDLLQQREELVLPVEQLRNGILEASTTVQDALHAIAESDLPAPAKEEAKNRITANLNQIELAKKRLEELKAIDLSPLGNSFTDVQRQIEKSNIEFEKATELDNVAKSKALSSIYGDFTSGKITKKQLDKNVFNIEKSDLDSQASRLTDTLDKRSGQLSNLQSIPNPNKDQKEIIEKTQKEIRDKELRLAQTRIQIAQKTAEGKRLTEEQILKDFQDANAKAAAIIQRQETQDIATIKGKQFKGTITKERADFDIAKVQEGSANKDLLEAKRQIAEFQKTRNQLTPETANKQEIELNKQMAAANLKAIEARLNTKEVSRQQVLSGLEFSNKQAEALSGTGQSNSTRAAKEKVLSADLTPQAQDQFSLEQTGIDGFAASSRVNEVKARIAQNKQLYKEGLKDARDFMLEQYALNLELAQANLAVVDQKITAEEKYREVVERNIQRIMQAEDNRFKSLTSQLDFQKASLDLYNQSLERTSKLEESRYNLAKALTDAATAPLETKQGNANRALDLSRKLKDDNLDPGVRNTINSQLSQMGFGTNELDILAKRSQIEDEIAAKKLEGLKLEQEYQRKALQLDLQRQKIAAETAVYDAQSAQLAAAKSKLEAEGALRIAQIKKDPIAIESAKVGLEIAGREIDLGDKRLDNALKNLGIQDELTKNATMAQEITGRTAIDQQLAADSTRKQQGALENAEARAPKKESGDLRGNVSEDKGKRRGRRPGRIGETFIENGRTIKDGVDITNHQEDKTPAPDLQLPKRIEINQLPELNRKPGENLFEAYQRHNELSLKGKSADMPPTDLLVSVLNKAGIQVSDSGYSQFAESLKMANQGIEQRLDKLIDSMSTVANTPRNLTVQTPNPVDDAAKLMNDLSRGQVVGAGF